LRGLFPCRPFKGFRKLVRKIGHDGAGAGGHKQGDVMGVKNLGRFDTSGAVPQPFATIAFHIAAVCRRAGNGADRHYRAIGKEGGAPGARCRSEG